MYIAKSDSQVAQRIREIEGLPNIADFDPTDPALDPSDPAFDQALYDDYKKAVSEHDKYIRIKALVSFSKWNKTHDIRACGMRQFMLMMYDTPYSKDVLSRILELIWFMGWDNYLEVADFDEDLVMVAGPGIII